MEKQEKAEESRKEKNKREGKVKRSKFAGDGFLWQHHPWLGLLVEYRLSPGLAAKLPPQLDGSKQAPCRKVPTLLRSRPPWTNRAAVTDRNKSEGQRQEGKKLTLKKAHGLNFGADFSKAGNFSSSPDTAAMLP